MSYLSDEDSDDQTVNHLSKTDDESEFYESDPEDIPDLHEKFPARQSTRLLDSEIFEVPAQEDRYPIDFEEVVNRDPVLGAIFLEVENAAQAIYRHKQYIKLCFYRLACIRDLKASNEDDADISKALAKLNLAEPGEQGESGKPINDADKAAQAALTELKTLCRESRAVENEGNKVLRNLIQGTGRGVDSCYNQYWTDDLCLVYYAIVSDACYPSPDNGQFSSNLRFSVHIVSHLYLVTGRPAWFETCVHITTTSFDHFLRSIPEQLNNAHNRQPARLGFLASRRNDSSSWMFQGATDITKLRIEREHWNELDATSYVQMKRIHSEKIFLIHISQQKIPAAILAKAASKPKIWNTWADATVDMENADGHIPLPPPEFVPGPRVVPVKKDRYKDGVPKPDMSRVVKRKAKKQAKKIEKAEARAEEREAKHRTWKLALHQKRKNEES